MTPTQTTPMPPLAPAPRGNGKPLNIILAVLGGLVILTVLVSTTRGAVASLLRDSFTQTAATNGVESLDISASAGSFDLRFADINEAKLEVTSSSSADWELRRDGDQLVVDSPDYWGNWCFFGCGFDENQATLVLPQSLNDGSLDAEFELAAGHFDATGSYKNLSVEVGAGELDLAGAAETAEVHLGAGQASISLDSVKEASFDISAGRMVGTLTGEAPRNITADVSAGSLELELPDVPYDVRHSVDAGGLNSMLAEDPASPHKITVGLSAGSASLYPQDSGLGSSER